MLITCAVCPEANDDLILTTDVVADLMARKGDVYKVQAEDEDDRDKDYASDKSNYENSQDENQQNNIISDISSGSKINKTSEQENVTGDMMNTTRANTEE